MDANVEGGSDGKRGQPEPRIVPPENLKFLTKDGTVPSWVAPLEDPTWLPLDEADHMRDDDPVIVVTPAERSYVLPWWVMKNHHVANLVLEDMPVTVTLCELCAGSAAFDARIDGERRSFQVVGKWKGTHIIADHETQGIWSSFWGECVWGFHRGVRLRQLPMFQARWEDCAGLQDGSVVVDGAGESREGHGGSLRPNTEGPPLSHVPGGVDTRIRANDLVLGVAAGGTKRAYRLADLQEAGGVLNDTVGGVDVVVFGGPGDYTAIAFRRALDDHVLHFRRTHGRIEDEESASIWDLTGFATSGPLAGKRLTFVDSHIEKWYSWAAYHPTTAIAGG